MEQAASHHVCKLSVPDHLHQAIKHKHCTSIKPLTSSNSKSEVSHQNSCKQAIVASTQQVSHQLHQAYAISMTASNDQANN
jgi:hypothetical protein